MTGPSFFSEGAASRLPHWRAGGDCCDTGFTCGSDGDSVVQIIIGDCIPDGTGGCQRAQRERSSGTDGCCTLPQGVLLSQDASRDLCGLNGQNEQTGTAVRAKQEDSCSACGSANEAEDSCQDGCCGNKSNSKEVKVSDRCSDCEPTADVTTKQDEHCACDSMHEAVEACADGCCGDVFNSGDDKDSEILDCCSDCGLGRDAQSDAGSCKDDCCASDIGDAEFLAEEEGDCCSGKDGACSAPIQETATDCCSDCTPNSASGDVSKDLCASDGPEVDSTKMDDCCDDRLTSGREDKCSTSLNAKPWDKSVKKDLDASPARIDIQRGNKEDIQSLEGEGLRRRWRIVHRSELSPKGEQEHTHRRLETHAHSTAHDVHRPSDHVHSHRTQRHHHHKGKARLASASNCSMESAFGRFFEAACCCIIDWGKAGLASKPSLRNLNAGSHRHGSPGHAHGNEHERRGHAKGGVAELIEVVNSVSEKPRSGQHGVRSRGKNFADDIAHTTLVPDSELGSKETHTLLLSVQGMDCPSCATKLTRALRSLPSVANVKVNTFTSQATLTYAEGVVLPEAIAKRAGEMTGFRCEVIEEAKIDEEGKIRVMRIGIDFASTGLTADFEGDMEKLNLPTGVQVKSVKASSPGLTKQIVLQVEYDVTVVQPRDVLDAFSPYGGTFVPAPKSTPGSQADKELHSLFRRTLFSAMLCIPVLVLSWAPLPSEHAIAYEAVSMALTTLIQTIVAYPLYSSALRSLFFQRMIDMDLLVVLSSSLAYIFSVVAFFLRVAGRTGFEAPFFETPAMLITLIMLGRLISAFARRRATQALDGIRAMQADTVELLQYEGSSSTTMTIPSELVHLNDILRVLPDSLVPTDGLVVHGTSQVDEASLTGESMPVEKAPGVALTAGTLNLSGVLDMRVARLPADSTLADIGRLMLQVQEARLPVQDLADRAASYLAPIILALAVVTFVIWLVVGMIARRQGGSDAAMGALRYAVAVLVVSCPCALVLCVPMVVVISAAVAAKQGILFKSVQAVQYAKNINVAVFDKTGTLTTGKLSVSRSCIARVDSLGRVLGLVSSSRHPVSEAVAKHIREAYPSIKENHLTDVKSIAGSGLQARDGHRLLQGGNIAWLDLSSHPSVQSFQGTHDEALTLFAVTTTSTHSPANTDLLAVFGLTDTIRPSARNAIQLLKQHDVDVYIVSGDEQPVVSALAAELAIAPDRALGRCTPQDKLARVRALQGSRTRTAVLFVGDGTNDGLALAQADVGVSLSGGTDIALSAADVVVLDSDAADLARALRVLLRVSQGAVRRVWLNFAWALVYNVFAVLLAGGAFVRVRIAPEYAGLGEMVSVLPVVLIAWSMWLLKQ